MSHRTDAHSPVPMLTGFNAETTSYGAVVSKTSFFMKLAPRVFGRADAKLAPSLNQGSGLTPCARHGTLPRQSAGVPMSNLRLTFACGPYDRTLALRVARSAPRESI